MKLNINKLAIIIAKRVMSVDEVSFDSMEEGSLCDYVSLMIFARYKFVFLRFFHSIHFFSR